MPLPRSGYRHPHATSPRAVTGGALPTVVVIGAMKCGTSAVHEHLDAHPDVVMSRPKELNFFSEQWDRGLDWYCRQFESEAPARGESSPGYTSPSYPEVADRMARVAPDVRLVYLVREPFTRALSQYAHHCRDGEEPRPPEEALLDPDSQYAARSRYVERLRPFLERFFRDQLLVVVQERLRSRPAGEMARVFEHVGVDPRAVAAPELDRVAHRGSSTGPPPADLRKAFNDRVADDVSALRDLLGDPLPEWQ